MNEQKSLFKVGEVYPDEAGNQIYIACSGKPEVISQNGQSLIGIRSNSTGTSVIFYWEDGKYNLSGNESRFDLIPPQRPKKRVPLGPEDVPPGSLFSNHQSNPESDWEMIIARRTNAFDTGARGLTWKAAMQCNCWIKFPGGAWQPMWKEIDDETAE